MNYSSIHRIAITETQKLKAILQKYSSYTCVSDTVQYKSQINPSKVYDVILANNPSHSSKVSVPIFESCPNTQILHDKKDTVYKLWLNIMAKRNESNITETVKHYQKVWPIIDKGTSNHSKCD